MVNPSLKKIQPTSETELSEAAIESRQGPQRLLKSTVDDCLSPEQLNKLDTEGFLLLPGVVAKEKVDEINLILDDLPLLKRFPDALAVLGLHRHGEIFRSLLSDPLILSAGQHFFGDVSNVRLLASSLREVLKDHTGSIQELHRDIDTIGELERPGYVAILYLDPSSVDCGATTLVPGSHLFDSAQLEHYTSIDTRLHSDELVVDAEAGDLLVFDAKLFHRGLNTLSDRRRVIQNQYVHAETFFGEIELPDEAAQLIGISPELLDDLSPLEVLLMDFIPKLEA